MKLEILDETPQWDWPKNAGKEIVAALNNKSLPATERELAASLAGYETVMDDGMAALLLSVINDNNELEEVRSQAAISLGPALEFGNSVEFDPEEELILSVAMFHDVRHRLKEFFLDTTLPKLVRRRILEASVRAPMEWHKEAIQTAYASEDNEWKLTAVFCMAYVKGFEPQILESLNNPDADISFEAVCGAGNWGVQEAWPHIKKLLTATTTEKWLKITAIDAAVNVNPDEAIDILNDLSLSDDEDIVDAAMDALSMIALGKQDEDDYPDDFEDDGEENHL